MPEHIPALIRPMPGYVRPELVLSLAKQPTESVERFRRETMNLRSHTSSRDRRDELARDTEAAAWVLSERRPAAARLRDARYALEIAAREVAQLTAKLEAAYQHRDIHQAVCDELQALADAEAHADVLAEAEAAAVAKEVAA